jgi:hypothetical protein
MNRTIALFLAMAVLLAHTIAIYSDKSGNFAFPLDNAHVAYRIARNFVHQGTLAWDPGSAPFDMYPSYLWIGVAAIAERLYLTVTTFCQTVCMIAMLTTIVVLASFSSDRLAGIIAPLLAVVSGPIATAGASGTETAVFTFLFTLSFFAFEKRRKVLLGTSLFLACLTRPEGLFVTVFFFLFTLVRRIEGTRRNLLPVFLAPASALLLTGIRNYSLTGDPVPPLLHELVSVDGENLRRGMNYVADFFLGSVGPLLLFFPIICLILDRLKGMGRRALLLTLAWSVMVVLLGGDTQPMGQAMVPVLPILFIAVQEGMTVFLDTERPALRRFTWVCFSIGLIGSGFGSRFPGNIGPLRTEELHRKWMEPLATPPFGFEQKRGRMGLSEHLDIVHRLRLVGLFMRDHLDPSHSVLSPWPGVIGYLSGLRVIDALGRTTPRTEAKGAWIGSPRADVAKALRLQPDYLVPQIAFTTQAPTEQAIASAWINRLDIQPKQPRRKLDLRKRFQDYELIAIPIPERSTRLLGELGRPFYLMRRRALDLGPILLVHVDGQSFRVEARSRGHDQLADLSVQFIDKNGGLWSMDPWGKLERGTSALARMNLVLVPSGMRTIELLRAPLPSDLGARTLRVCLRNPGAEGDHGFAYASAIVQVNLR